jgi:hypothetical protein
MDWYLIYAADEFTQGFQGTYKIKIDEYDSDYKATEDAIGLSYEAMQDFNSQAINDIVNDIVDNTIEEYPELKGFFQRTYEEYKLEDERASLYDSVYEKVCDDNVYYRLYKITDEAILTTLKARPLTALEYEEIAAFDPELFAENHCEEIS